MTGVRLAIFDLDGTLIDSRHNIVRAVNDAASIVGLAPPPPDVVPRVIGLSLDEALSRLFPAADPKALVELDRVYRDCFVRYRAGGDYDEPIFAGVHETLAALDQASVVLAIATGKARRGVDYFLDRNGLVGRFAAIETPDTAPGKPHPGMVLQAMAATGAVPEMTVMIGDTTFDMLMARAAKAHAVGVSWGNHDGTELSAAGAHCLIDRLVDLPQVMDGLTL
ncbi:MAG: HAD family hydrolase [Rhodospirillaceae bacterium]|nr:MAG: HAD family hydrolase [Rhodospirillaceae bacterium]